MEALHSPWPTTCRYLLFSSPAPFFELVIAMDFSVYVTLTLNFKIFHRDGRIFPSFYLSVIFSSTFGRLLLSFHFLDAGETVSSFYLLRLHLVDNASLILFFKSPLLEPSSFSSSLYFVCACVLLKHTVPSVAKFSSSKSQLIWCLW